ncbi:MAG: cell envelope biogenesis protein OmpA [Cytophagales bacterium]|nr:MAG: cell envelope biogenesis protein OmpA [Cytophagales bacterium]
MKLNSLVFFVFLILSTSCIVSKKKYDELARQKAQLELDKADCEERTKALGVEKDRLSDQIKQFSDAVIALEKDSVANKQLISKLNKEIAALNDSYNKISKSYEKLQTNSNSEIAKREKDLMDLEKKNNLLKIDLQDREIKVKELEKIIADKEKATKDLKDRVSKALLSFKDKDISVNVKNGKVYVSLAEQLLFKSGSTKVDAKGVDALKKLAEALKDENDVSVLVEGHTDDVAIAKGTSGMEDNWDLSVLRATSITRILLSAGLSPKRISPSGRGEFMPVAEGKSAEARQKNRRTEIILTPKLDDLFKILEQ